MADGVLVLIVTLRCLKCVLTSSAVRCPHVPRHSAASLATGAALVAELATVAAPLRKELGAG
jgi:hypothetical protein